MATSGSFNTAAYTTGGKTRYLTFSWERTSYSVDKNTSTISYTLKGNGTYTGYINTRNITLVINGTTVYTETGPIKVYNGTVLKSGTITISHNSDGTKSFSASAECGIYYSAINSTGSGSFTLNTIPRKSTVKATNGDIGSTSTITITRASSSFTHTLTWSCSGLSGTFATKTTATSVKATIPTSIYAKIPNAKTVTVTVTCETFNGSTSLGTNTCTFTATANESVCKPSLTYTAILDINTKTTAVTGDNTKFIKGISNAQISGVSATGNNSATIKSIVFKCDTQSANVSNGTATINAVTSGTFTVTATDSRGYSNTVTYKPTIYDYTKPTITAKAYRPQQTGSEIKADFSGKYSTGVPTNHIKVDCRYSENGGAFTGWVTLTPTISNGNFSGSLSLGTAFDYRNEYKFEFRVTDLLNSITYSVTVIRGVPVFDYGQNDFNFNVPLYYQGEAMDFIVEYGTKSVSDSATGGTVTWYYEKRNSGIAMCWATREISGVKADQSWAIISGVSLYYVTAPVEIPYPFTFVSVPNEVAKVGCNNMSGWDLTSAVNTVKATGKYSLIRPTAATTTTYTVRIHYQVIGRWK